MKSLLSIGRIAPKPTEFRKGIQMNKIAQQLFLLVLSAVTATTLLSCSGGGDSDAGTSSLGTGTVGVLLTDKPADPSQFEAINASIEKVELLGGEDNRVVLYSGSAKTYDLLSLKNESVPFTFKDGVPVGTYCKIRLILSDLELVLVGGETYHPKLPGNGKIDLVARDCFYVGAGLTVTLQLDIDAGNSIHIVANKKGFNFRPVIFVDVLSQEFEPRLVRLEGEITSVDDQQNTLLLCDAIPTQQMNSEGCVDINLGDESAYFDNVMYNGTPRPLSELLDQGMVGERVTVVGLPRYTLPPYTDVEIPEGHYPPPGECKLWDINLEAGEQSPPGDCEELAMQVSDTLVLVDHDGVVKDMYYPLMAVDAIAVEYGQFLQLTGNVATDADTTGFDMAVSTGSPVISSDNLAIEFQSGDVDVNGTRIVSKTGSLLQPADVVVPLGVQADGVLELVAEDDPILHAALLILDIDGAGTEQVTGTILSVGTSSITIAPDNDTVCGVATSELFVTLTPDVDILTVTITESGNEIVPGGTPAVGQTVGMNGSCDAGDYVTDNLVILDDQQP
jgi:hypothetical protein